MFYYIKKKNFLNIAGLSQLSFRFLEYFVNPIPVLYPSQSLRSVRHNSGRTVSIQEGITVIYSDKSVSKTALK